MKDQISGYLEQADATPAKVLDYGLCQELSILNDYRLAVQLFDDLLLRV